MSCVNYIIEKKNPKIKTQNANLQKLYYCSREIKKKHKLKITAAENVEERYFALISWFVNLCNKVETKNANSTYGKIYAITGA